MSVECKEAIILAFNTSIPGITISKPILKLNNYTLLDHQISWLVRNKIDHVIIASNEKYPVYSGLENFVEFSIEPNKRGTAGAVLVASDLLKTNLVYVMNIDDLLFGFNPQLMTFPDAESKIVVSNPTLWYGKVELRKDLVLEFKEKPLLNCYVSCGHYLFKKHIIDRYFPDIGYLEESVLPKLAKERKLFAHKLTGKWISLNTLNDYLEAKSIISSLH